MGALQRPERRSPAVNPFTGRWVMEPKVQNVWGIPHAIWFALMGIGGALFINLVVFDLELGRFFGMSVAKLVSLVLIGIGGLVLIGDLGRPLRLLRVLVNPWTSWISVGAIADFVFVIFGGLWMVADLEIGGSRPLAGLPWAGDSALGIAFQAIAGLAAFVVIVYPGLVLAFSPSIPFWNTTLVPLQFLAFAFSSAFGIAVIAAVVSATGFDAATWAPFLGATLVFSFLLVAAHLLNASYTHATAAVSLRRLVRGDLRVSFLGGLMLVGLALPGLLLVVGGSVGSNGSSDTASIAFAAAGAAAIVGNWFSKYAVIRAGTYAPYP
jgi:formate-dependent nitrite reductase membrane component NrfD